MGRALLQDSENVPIKYGVHEIRSLCLQNHECQGYVCSSLDFNNCYLINEGLIIDKWRNISRTVRYKCSRTEHIEGHYFSNFFFFVNLLF